MYGELVWGRVVVLRNTRRGNHHSGAPTERAPPSHACTDVHVQLYVLASGYVY
jgi:hypothetical protein